MKTLNKRLALLLAAAIVLSLGAVPAWAAAPEISVEETVLADNEDITVTITGYDPGGFMGPSFEVLLENHTDKDLSYSMIDVSVNGVMCRPSFDEDVAAGKKSYVDLEWFSSDLEESGINYIETVSGTLLANERETYDEVYRGAVSWATAVGETDVPAAEPRTFDHGFAEQEILTGDVVFTVVDYDADGGSDGSPLLVFYMENHSGKRVSFCLEDVYVNGFACDPWWSLYVTDGSVAYSECEWWRGKLEDSHIDQIETVEFTVRAEVGLELIGAADVVLDLTGGGAEEPAVEEPVAEEPVAEEPAVEEPTPEEPAVEEPAVEEPMAEEPVAEEPVAEEPAAEEPAPEEPIADEPAAEEGPIDPAALAGGLDPDNPVYSNEVFRMSCSFDRNWGVVVPDKLAASVGWDESSGESSTEYLGEYLLGGKAATVMYINSDDKNQIISIPVNAYTGAGQFKNGSDVAAQNVLFFLMSAGTMYETLGMQNCEMVPDTVTLNGVVYDGIAFQYEHVDKNTGETVPGYSQWLFLVKNDYENDQDLVMNIRLTSYGEDHIDDMLNTLTMPADG